jgi:hypothetical protein
MTFGVTCVLSRAQVTWDRSSILPHQDATDLRTRIDNLKSLLELASIGQLQEVPRQGNAILRAQCLAFSFLDNRPEGKMLLA